MSINNFNLVQEWEKGRLPIISGILHENGNVSWINIESENRIRRVEHGSKLNFNNLMEENEFYLSEITVLCRKEDINKSIIVSCGEGGYGSEGFVVVEVHGNKKIKWVAFFEESNPFEKVEIIDDMIYAYNNLGEKWTFEINNPTNLRIE